MPSTATTLLLADPDYQDALRERLHDFMTDPYRQNPVALQSMHIWFDNVFSNDQQGWLKLDFVQISNTLTGESCDGFQINDTMLVSDKIAALMAIQPRGPQDHIPADLRVGIWLKDFGDYSDLHKASKSHVDALLPKQKTRTVINLDEDWFPEVEFITNAIEREFKPYMPGRNARQFLGQGEVRYQKHAGLDEGIHNDYLTNKLNEEEVWAPVVIHPFLRTGTDYRLPTYDDGDVSSFRVASINVRCPTYATSCHMAVRAHVESGLQGMGARHQAVPHADGRGVLIYPDTDTTRTWFPIRGNSSPWEVTSVPLTL